MTVAELEELLAMLPADMGVCIRMSGLACRHITRVDKAPSQKIKREFADAWAKVCNATTAEVDGRHPPMLILEAGMSAPLWCHAFASDVDFTVKGRWPDAARREVHR